MMAFKLEHLQQNQVMIRWKLALENHSHIEEKTELWKGMQDPRTPQGLTALTEG